MFKLKRVAMMVFLPQDTGLVDGYIEELKGQQLIQEHYMPSNNCMQMQFPPQPVSATAVLKWHELFTVLFA